jgi:uroporphyrinogen-III synthase
VIADESGVQPLAGKRILVTRARHQAGQLSSQLAAQGAEVIEIPAIEILPPDSFDPLDIALRSLDRYQWLIVTSANTVRVLAERMAVIGIDTSAFAHLKIAAVGSATAQALREVSLDVHITPKEYVAESLLTSIGDELGDDLSGTRVLLARSAIARDIIPETLTARGALIDVVDAYRTVIPENSAKRIADVFASAERAPHAATFTSSSAVTNFFLLLQEAGIDRPPASMKAISIGPITSQTLRGHQREPDAEAKPHDLQGLIAAVVAALAAR